MNVKTRMSLVALFVVCGLWLGTASAQWKIVVLGQKMELAIDFAQQDSLALSGEILKALGQQYQRAGGKVEIEDIFLRAFRDTQNMPKMFSVEAQFKSFSRTGRRFIKGFDFFGSTIICYTEDMSGSDAVRAIAVKKGKNEVFSASWLLKLARAYATAHDALKDATGEANPEYYGIKMEAAALVTRMYKAGDDKLDEAVENFIENIDDYRKADRFGAVQSFASEVSKLDVFDSWNPCRTYYSGEYCGEQAAEILNEIIENLGDDTAALSTFEEPTVAVNEPSFQGMELLSTIATGSGSQI